MAAVVDVVDQCGWVGEEGRGPIGVVLGIHSCSGNSAIWDVGVALQWHVPVGFPRVFPLNSI